MQDIKELLQLYNENLHLVAIFSSLVRHYDPCDLEVRLDHSALHNNEFQWEEQAGE